MQISGQMKTTCPPAFLLGVLRDPAAMRQLLPVGSSVNQTGAGVYSFTITKSVGPIKLTLPGTLTLTPTGTGHDHTMTIRASHIIGGKVTMDLHIGVTRPADQSRITYTGDLDGSGLAGRILNEHRARANGVLDAAMARLKRYAERELAKAKAAAATSG